MHVENIDEGTFVASQAQERAGNKRKLDWSFIQSGHLYGRDVEFRNLYDAFLRRLSPYSGKEMILISGKSGTGKTALARMLEIPVTSDYGGIFIEGKFDQLQRPEPYAPLIGAFTDLVHIILEEGPTKVKEIRDSVMRAVDGSASDARLLMDMIPALDKILGPGLAGDLQEQVRISINSQEEGNLSIPPIVKGGAEAQTRMKMMLRNFARAICSLDQPLVLVVDDLQWADSGSLDLIQTLVSDGENQGLVIVAICRSNEVSFYHDFSCMLRQLEDEKGTIITHLEVYNLCYEDTLSLVSDVLQLPERQCTSLADAVYFKTDGNVFFVVQFLQTLYENGGVWEAPPGSVESSCSTNTAMGQPQHWDEEKLQILQRGGIDVNDFVIRRIQRLPEETQMLLKTLACVGAEIDEKLLFKLFSGTINVTNTLAYAVEQNVILRKQDFHHHEKCSYAFSHDRFQHASYSLIPDGEEDSIHLSIGRSLRKQLSSEELNMNLFLVVNQMSRGVGLIEEQKEKDSLANLCFQAGEKAIMCASDFKTATIYLWFGINLLGRRRWRDHYALTLALYNTVAEAEYCVGNFEPMDKAVQEVLVNASSFNDKIRAHSAQIYALGARLQLQEAIDLGLYTLEKLGETFPQKLSTLALYYDIAKTRIVLHGKSDKYFMNLPDIENSEKVTAIGILNLLTTYTFVGRQELFPFIANRLVRLSIKYGLSAISAVGFCMYGCTCCSLGDFRTGHRYGQLGLSILERYKERGCHVEWIPRVYLWFYGIISQWKQPLRTGFEPLLLGHRVGIETGDIEYSAICAFIHGYNGLWAGTPLEQLEVQNRSSIEWMKTYKQSTWSTYLGLVTQMAHNLMGNSSVSDVFVLSGEIMNQDKVLQAAIDDDFDTFIADLQVMRMMLGYIFGNYDLALEMAQISRNFNFDSSFLLCIQPFYDGLTALAVIANELYGSGGPADSKSKKRKQHRREHLSVARRCMKTIRKLSSFCPQNCKHKLLLMEAELAAIQGKINVAMDKYDRSIELAGKEGFLHEQAIACERAAMALLRKATTSLNATINNYTGNNKMGDNTSKNFKDNTAASRVAAEQYMRKACTLYKMWGAVAKANRMHNEMEATIGCSGFLSVA